MDEIFKGTNTREWVAIARAVLKYLPAGKNKVIASTHDSQLVLTLAEQYDAYHFCGTISQKELLFDYKLKPGHLYTQNAVKILESFDFPPEVLNECKLTESYLG